MDTDNQPFDLQKVQEKLKNVKTLEDITGANGVVQEMVKSTIERILKAEQESFLGYAPHEEKGRKSGNNRNGYSKKTIKTSNGDIELDIPRDRNGEFSPQLIQKHKRVDRDLEKKIIGMYSRGMSVRDITAQLEELYGTSVSPALISKVTDSVLEGVREWQARPLHAIYPVIFLDAIHYKIRQDGKVTSKAAYTCLGIDLDGIVDVLGIWIGETEGAHFWQSVLADLQARGVKDVLIACIDGLKGFPEAIEAVFPKTQVQLCIVHQIRSSLRYLASKYQRDFTKDMKEVYRASNEENALLALEEVEKKWKGKADASLKSWRANWDKLATFFQFPQEVRKMIYTTNAVEALHRQFRKVTKTKGAFPHDEALKKMLYLATLDLKGSFRSKRDWPTMLGQLKNVFGDRIPESEL